MSAPPCTLWPHEADCALDARGQRRGSRALARLFQGGFDRSEPGEEVDELVAIDLDNLLVCSISQYNVRHRTPTQRRAKRS
jgi:hypothetical protein